MRVVTRVRSALWIACACVLLCAPSAAAADRSLRADLDGDGHTDQVSINRSEPSVLHVWLSTTGTTHLIRSPRALLRIAATDVDGDHRPELIATEASASELRVWKRDGPRRGFEAYTPPRAPDHAAPSPKVKTLGGDPDDVEDALAGPVYGPPAVRGHGPVTACCTGGLTHVTQPDHPVASRAWSRPRASRAPPASPA